MFDLKIEIDPQTPWSDQFSAALANDLPNEISRLLSGRGQAAKFNHDYWTGACTSASPPTQALSAWVALQPPSSKWIADLIDLSVNSRKIISWEPLMNMWVNCPDIAPDQKNLAIREGVIKLIDLLEANKSPSVFRDFIPALTKADASWVRGCGPKGTVIALLADVLLPQCSGITDNFSSEALGFGYLQALSSPVVIEMIWGLDNYGSQPQRAIERWNEWLSSRPSRLSAWNDLTQLDKQSISVLNDWSTQWLENDRWEGSRLSKWMTNPAAADNPFDHPLFMGDSKHPTIKSLARSIPSRDLNTQGSPEMLVISMAQELFRGTRTLDNDSRSQISDALVSSAVFNILPAAPDIVSIACRSKSPWVHEISKNKNTALTVQQCLTDRRTLYYWHSNQTPESLLKVISSNKDLWKDWKDENGANLLLSWCNAQNYVDIPDKFARAFYNLMPRWFSQPDLHGRSLLTPGILSDVVRSQISKDLLDNQTSLQDKSTPTPLPQM